MSVWPWFLAFNATGLTATAACAFVSVSPANNFWGTVHSRGANDNSHYALTFDDGPHPQSTPAILDILGELDAKAAFFVIGRFAQRHPELIERIHREGHLIGNHAWDHSRWMMLRGARYCESQLQRTEAMIASITGVRPALFRPPFGVRTCFTMRAARQNGNVVVTWSLRARDGVATTQHAILARLGRARGGDVLLLHDGVEPGMARDASATVAALKPLMLQLRDRALSPMRLDTLLGLPARKSADAGTPIASSPE